MKRMRYGKDSSDPDFTSFKGSCQWVLLLDGVPMAYAAKKEHLARTKLVLGGQIERAK